MEEPVRPAGRGRDRSSRWRAVLAVVVRALACAVVAGVVGAPLAVSWAVTSTEVVSHVGTFPTTFSLTTSGHSEVRLGLAGTIYVPQSRGPVGVAATVIGPGDPGAGDGDLADYVSPEMVELYAGLFHHPEEAVQEVVVLVEQELRRQLLLAATATTGGGGAVLFVLSYLLPWRGRTGGRGQALRLGAVVLLLVVVSAGVAWAQVRATGDDGTPGGGSYVLPVLDGTAAEGSTTNSPVLRALLGGAVTKARVLVDRQEAAVAAYRERAEQGLTGQASAMEGPRDGELAVLVQSDMHCNLAMIALQSRVVSLLEEQHGPGALALLAIAGDLTTNGTAAEGTCIRDEAAIVEDTPIAAITGNHESAVSAEQMADAGMTVLDGSTEELDGVRVLGDGDPSRTELFGGSSLRGEETQEEQGQRLHDTAAEGDRPDLLLVHEGYAAAAFLGVADMRAFMASPASPASLDEPVEDDVRDLPAGAVLYGHWHRSIEPRVVWNSDGTWTLVMELDTSGGAVATSTLDNFSTPWSPPQQQAAFPVLFLDEETRLVTGYQLYRFDTDGTVTVDPRVDVGTR